MRGLCYDKKMKLLKIIKQNKVISIFIFLIVVLILIIFSLITQNKKAPSIKLTPIETDDFQNYYNTVHNFSLQYPSNYFLKTHDTITPTSLTLFISSNNNSIDDKNIDKEMSESIFSISFQHNFIGNIQGSIKNPEEWVAFQKTIGSEYTLTNIAGKKAYFTKNKIDNSIFYCIYIKNGEMYSRYSIKIKDNDIGKKILSSFTFND